jgi:protein disulfide-isomerase A6
MAKNILATILVLIGLISLGSAQSLYSANSKVVKLTSSNFKDLVVNSKDVWFVEFYAPWCGHCKNLVPEWEKLASALDGIIKVGAVDMTTDQDAGAAFGIRGFPTLKFFGANKNSPVDYQGARSVNEMLNFAFDNAKRTAEGRLGGGSTGGFNTGGQAGGNAGGSCGGPGPAGGQAGGQGNCGGGQQQQGGGGSGNDKDVIVLTDANFNEVLGKSDDLWIVEFYAPWCGHCKNLEPQWNKAASDLKDNVKVAKVDATTSPSLAQRFGVNSYPQIKLFPSGPKSDNLIEDFQGARDAGTITAWALEKKAQFKQAVKVVQLVNQEVFDKYCTNLRGICFVGFLPHIYDSSATERNNYIKIFQDLAQAHRSDPVTFSWAQGGDYYGFEESLGLGSGYPAFVGLSVNKMKYAPLTGAFNQKNIDLFVKSLISGKTPLFNLREAPKVNKVNEWDGKDAQPQYTSSEL